MTAERTTAQTSGMTSALNKYVFSCLPASEKNPRGTEKHNDSVKKSVGPLKASLKSSKAKPKADTHNPEFKDKVHNGTQNPEFKDKVHNGTHNPGVDIKLQADRTMSPQGLGALKATLDTQVKLIEKHEQDIKDKPPNEQISGFDIPDNASVDVDALYEKIATYEFPMERYYLNAKDARRRETLATTCRLSNQKITSALNGLIRGRV